MIATETPTCIISVKIVNYAFAAETFTCVNAAETSNCIIATVTYIIATKAIHQDNGKVNYHQHNCNRTSKSA